MCTECDDVDVVWPDWFARTNVADQGKPLERGAWAGFTHLMRSVTALATGVLETEEVANEDADLDPDVQAGQHEAAMALVMPTIMALRDVAELVGAREIRHVAERVCEAQTCDETFELLYSLIDRCEFTRETMAAQTRALYEGREVEEVAA